MSAAPQYGTVFLRGVQTGRTYAVDIYISDVANASVNFDSGSGASSGSDSFYIAPENVVFEDFSIVSGLTDTTKYQLMRTEFKQETE